MPTFNSIEHPRMAGKFTTKGILMSALDKKAHATTPGRKGKSKQGITINGGGGTVSGTDRKREGRIQ